ncbi:PAQR family membrane homeostasis protein TrhA [Maribacter aurantiacus]|uniref:Hemolysin III family protein n=1 Tax=Maribacter aurantiacus TaxID=1882343 RepID=A0A5R8LT32_9FLAO|nr:hemolysin III family protein [Maribacter aurantiacus]TLF40333.1 hemolysin III family protein [Maribacter aurantiacus]
MNLNQLFKIGNQVTEERLNSLSHFCGVIAACIGLIFLWKDNNHRSVYSEFSIGVYGISLIVLFASSTSYHFVDNPSWKKRLRILDHINIYYLIAGTYTPVALITLVNGNGWTLFYIVWAIAALGTALKIFYTGRFEFISLLLYLVMGWLIVFDLKNLLANSTSLGLTLLFLGGIFYSVGIIFYAIQRIPYNHFIWHLFVLAGAFCHWFFLYTDVI